MENNIFSMAIINKTEITVGLTMEVWHVFEIFINISIKHYLISIQSASSNINTNSDRIKYNPFNFIFRELMHYQI